MRRILLPGWAAFFLLLLLPGGAGFAQPEENARITEIRDEIKSSQQVMVELTNDTDRAQWQQRIDLLQQDLENVQRLKALEEKEVALTEQQRQSAVYELREALRSVDSNRAGLSDAAKKLNEQISALRADKAGMVQKRQRYQVDAETNAENLADVEQQIRNKNEEILAVSLQRDASEIRLRLTEEADRIDQHIRDLPINPRPTIRMILDKKHYIGSEEKNVSDMQTLLSGLRAHRTEVSSGLSLSRAKFANLDLEIDLLQKKKQVTKSREEVSRLLYITRSEKRMFADRLTLQARQEASLGESIDLATQLGDLYQKEVTYLAGDLASLLSNYWHRLLYPVCFIVFLLMFYLAIARFVLPRIYTREDLFISRRLGNYLVVLLILLTLGVFFMEDLKAIATVMGIAGAAVVIALQDLCSSFAGYFVIIASRKLAVGNRVEIDGHRGDVIDIQLLRTTLIELNNWLEVDEPTGRVIIIPNSFIFKNQVFNFSHVHPYVWAKIDITVTYETPFQEAHDLLKRILEEENKPELEEAGQAVTLMERKYGIADTQYCSKIFSTIADSGVLYRLIYVCHYRKIAGTRSKINRRILEEFEKDKRMQFAYPTQRHIPTPEPGGFQVRLDKSP